MKVCDLTQSYAPSGGGVRTYLLEKQKFIARHPDLEHVLIIPGEADGVTRQGNLAVYTIASGLIKGCEPYRFTLRLDKVIAILKRERPQIIELGDAYVLPHAGFRMRRVLDCALVGFYHTDFPTAYVEKPVLSRTGPRMARSARQMAENYARYIYNRCDATVTSSPELERRLGAMDIQGVRRIPLGVDLVTFHPNRRDEAFRRALGVAVDDPLLVYAGRLDHEKRVEVILDAFEKIREDSTAHLLLIGEGVLKPLVLQRSKRNPRLHVRPFEPSREALATALASADGYVTAGPHETFGLSIIEAQACGLPVIGVKAGALVERVPDHAGFLGRVDSVPDMAAHMLQIGGLDARRKGLAARAWVAAHFGWESTFRQLFTLYDETLAHGLRESA